MNTEVINKKEQFLKNFIGQYDSGTDSVQDKVLSEAKSALEELEFPTTRDEYWKYTRVNSILKGIYTQEPAFDVSSIDSFKIKGMEANLLVFINGFYSSELSDIKEEKGLTVVPMAKARNQHADTVNKHFGKYADHKSQIFTALNTVYNTNGAFIHVKENAVIEKPVHVMNITNGDSAAFNPRNLFIAGKNSEAKVISSYETLNGSSFVNAVSEIIVGENAKLDHYLLQNDCEDSTQVNTTQVYQERDSNYSLSTVTFNGGLIRNNVNVAVDGENCQTDLYGIYLIKGKQHVDNHTFIEHIKPHCESNELYKGIMNERSTGVFNGKVYVHPEAQKTNAYQSNQNILLTDNATINSKPELEIYADDVKCSHGSTTGQMDEEALYYLRSRGISLPEAQRMLIQAFVADVVDHIKILPLKQKIQDSISKRYESITLS